MTSYRRTNEPGPLEVEGSTAGATGGGDHGFMDPVSGRRCYLVTGPEVGVRHPNCQSLADLAIELDAFYCRACKWNGRISGGWALDVIKSAQS